MIEFFKNLFSQKVNVEWTVPSDFDYDHLMDILSYFNGSLDEHIVFGDEMDLYISYPKRKELEYQIMLEHMEN